MQLSSPQAAAAIYHQHPALPRSVEQLADQHVAFIAPCRHRLAVKADPPAKISAGGSATLLSSEFGSPPGGGERRQQADAPQHIGQHY